MKEDCNVVGVLHMHNEYVIRPAISSLPIRPSTLYTTNAKTANLARRKHMNAKSKTPVAPAAEEPVPAAAPAFDPLAPLPPLSDRPASERVTPVSEQTKFGDATAPVAADAGDA